MHSEEEISGRPYLEFVSHRDGDKVRRLLKQIIEGTKVRAILVSDRKRTHQTALALSAHANLKPQESSISLHYRNIQMRIAIPHSICAALGIGGMLFAFPLAASDLPTATVEETFTLADIKIDSINVSGIAVRDNLLVIGTDEECSIQVFEKSESNSHWTSVSEPIALGTPCEEVDIEGIAWGRDHVYVIGSHSLARKKVKSGKTVKKNHERLAKEPKNELSRKQVFRLKLMSDGTLEAGSVERISLDGIFSKHAILKSFREIPSKENGIDIEAIAVNSEELLVGFRGPVLRGPFTPVLALTLQDDPFVNGAVHAEDRFLNLGGRGIRGMTEVPGRGYLVLGGPVGDAPVPYQLYFWTGQDALPGSDVPDADNRVKPICRITCPDIGSRGDSLVVRSDNYVSCEDSSAKAEGVELVEMKDGALRFIVVYDTAPNGTPTLFSCPFKI